MLIIALIALLGFSVYSYQTSNQEREGFFACNNDGTICELSQHIHADIEMSVCGEKIEFEKEKGNVNLQHTHKETNKIHWHARISVDPKTKEPLDPTPRAIAAFLDQMEYEFPKSCSNNQNPILDVFINDEPTDPGLNYVWKDGDKITVSYN